MGRLSSIGLLCLSGCDALFAGYQRNHPQNCVEDPQVCSATEVCNQITQVCEATDGGGNGDFGGGMPTLIAYSFAAGDGPYSLALGDLNMDGKVDIAVAANGANTNRPGVQVLLSDGQGGFAAPIRNIAGTDPSSVVIADFDSDGKPDIAVASVSDSGNGSIRILNGDGTGMVGNCGNIKINMKDGPFQLVAADFNGDLKPDLAVANSASNTVSILLNNDMCRFNEQPRISVDAFPWRLAVVDVDGDQVPDIVVASRDTGKVNQLKGLGGGAFQNVRSYSIGMSPSSLAVADWNGDGKPDLAVADYTAQRVSVLLNNAAGGYGAPSNYTAGVEPFAVTGADV